MMTCYRKGGGCGPYEMLSCGECPASKPDYLATPYEGLKVKYLVRKVSNGELIDGCFVLRPNKDKAAVAALHAYADATENKVLAHDIRKWLEELKKEE